MKDGLVMFYMKDETLYPIVMNEENAEMFRLLQPAIFPDGVKVVFDNPQCKAVDLRKVK
jgi:hypothetical protein